MTIIRRRRSLRRSRSSRHSSSVPLPSLMEDYLAHLELRDKALTAVNRQSALRDLAPWMTKHGIDPLRATTEQLQAYQQHLATDYRSAAGQSLSRRSQQNRIGAVKAWYHWLEQRGHVVVDPSRSLRLRVPKSRVVVSEPLTLQEATALVQTQAHTVSALRVGSYRWAVEMRNLALVCLALATGRRRSGLIDLTVAHVDCDQREVRVEREKSQMGRILPAASWAMEVVRLYVTTARPLLVRAPDVPWLFLDRSGANQPTTTMLWFVLQNIIARTIAQNPDLDALPRKRITWHTFRVSFATLLFANGCDIRSINELLLHRLLSTPAQYTPLGLDDLRHVLKTSHPRVRGC